LRVEEKLDISTPTTNKFVKNTTNLYKQKEKHKAQGKIENINQRRNKKKRKRNNSYRRREHPWMKSNNPRKENEKRKRQKS
jgi:hypothetical protein